VDARPVLDANPEMFLDMCHPDEVGHMLIAELVLLALRDVAPALAQGALNINTEGAVAKAGRKLD
jgi:phospholipase/lecithinase/hemolysin